MAKGNRKNINTMLNAFEAYFKDDQLIRYMPRDFLRYSNLRESRGLIRMSTN